MEEIQKYRQMLEEGNPADLTELSGQELWSAPRGPKQASLEQCDLGLGPGRLAGAYAQLPRYFADTGKVQDAESRLVTCMITLQGFTLPGSHARLVPARLGHRGAGDLCGCAVQGSTRSMFPQRMLQKRRWSRSGGRSSGAGPGRWISPAQPATHRTGAASACRRCLTFTDPGSTRSALATWPAYRVSQSSVWTMQRRLIDCFRQMRWAEPAYLSDAVIAVELYLQKEANGGLMQAPGIKR